MIKTFTHEKLLRYVYNELPADEQHEVEQVLLHDADLAAICADLLLAQRTLNSLRRKSSQRSTDAILRYSRTFLRSA
jgi:hypothetical protein